MLTLKEDITASKYAFPRRREKKDSTDFAYKAHPHTFDVWQKIHWRMAGHVGIFSKSLCSHVASWVWARKINSFVYQLALLISYARF